LLLCVSGKIDLNHAEIKRHDGPINKYDYVIDVITPKRVFYLCFTSKTNFNTWLRKLRDIHDEMVSIRPHEESSNDRLSVKYNS